MGHYDAVVRFVLKAAAVGIAGILLLTYLLEVRPVPRDRVNSADAVVVLAGDDSRVATGVELAERGASRVLVLSNGNAKGRKATNALCQQPHTYEVVCPAPASDSTKGEAETIARLARDRKWNRIVLVSSNYHLRRARTVFHRCFKGELRVYASEPDRLALDTWVGALLEWPKLARTAVARDC